MEDTRESTFQQGPRVLVVDDNPELLQMVERYLEAQGFAVATTDAPFAVLEKLREHSPDVVVLDLMIPGLDGSALAGFVHSHSTAKIVFFTASSPEALEALRLEHPAAIVVRKGGPLTVLEDAIRDALP